MIDNSSDNNHFFPRQGHLISEILNHVFSNIEQAFRNLKIPMLQKTFSLTLLLYLKLPHFLLRNIY